MFGDDNDLQIYHDSNNSYIDDAGDGSLFLRSGTTYIQNAAGTKTSIVTNAGAGQTLYHNNTPVFVTTATGIDVTGNITFGDNHAIVSDNNDNLVIESSSSEDVIIKAGSGVIEFRDAGQSGSPLRMKIDTDGKVGIGTDSPDEILTLNSSSNTRLLLQESGNDKGHIGAGGGGLYIKNLAGDVIFRNSSDADTVRIKNGGNVGIGTTDPSEKLEVAGTTKAEQYLLDAIAKDISDTAVDVFVYDTRKDSDGGAWRKRTQHTSWYNETLNTSTRGSRKEFPAVAVIVSDSTASETYIYDGDDPDMPMWMTFDNSANSILRSHGTAMSLAMLNGKLMVGLAPNDAGVAEIDFLSDSSFRHTTNAGYANKGIYKGNIAERNSSNGFDGIITNTIINIFVNDVAMTVLPNAPIDAATGLPTPTIALATNGGVSVIKDNGTVSNLTPGGGVLMTSCDFDLDHNLVMGRNSFILMRSDHPHYLTNQVDSGYAINNRKTSTPSVGEDSTGKDTFRNVVGISSSFVAYDTEDLGLGLYSKSGNNAASMVANITSDYNTGWMNGDIKLATLSDTDDTNVTGPSILTNYNFSSGNLTGWTLTSADAGGGIYANQNPVYVATSLVGIGNTGSVRQNITVETGKKYIVGYKCDRRSSSQFRLGIYFGHIGGSIVFDDTVANGQTRLYYWTSDYTGTTLLQFRGRGGGDGEFTNFIFDEVEEDRSANGNGLQVFGTVTKNPVATGADLVAYSGWSQSGGAYSSGVNYLNYPHTTALGTSDFHFAAWLKFSTDGGQQTILSSMEADGQYAGPYLSTYTSGTVYMGMYTANQTNAIQTPYQIANGAPNIADNTWHHAVFTKSGTNAKVYIDGKFTVESNSFYSTTATFDVMNIGANYRPFNGSIALLRLSATAPSAEQIKKMYNDEKFLFQENAKATLYGSSDAVTALAYDDDTELLHVGTSAGRSVFQGLRRIDNTTDAVGAAISASNGMVAED